jgi:hypothetical protein
MPPRRHRAKPGTSRPGLGPVWVEWPRGDFVKPVPHPGRLALESHRDLPSAFLMGTDPGCHVSTVEMRRLREVIERPALGSIALLICRVGVVTTIASELNPYRETFRVGQVSSFGANFV